MPFGCLVLRRMEGISNKEQGISNLEGRESDKGYISYCIQLLCSECRLHAFYMPSGCLVHALCYEGWREQLVNLKIWRFENALGRDSPIYFPGRSLSMGNIRVKAVLLHSGNSECRMQTVGSANFQLIIIILRMIKIKQAESLVQSGFQGSVLTPVTYVTTPPLFALEFCVGNTQ